MRQKLSRQASVGGLSRRNLPEQVVDLLGYRIVRGDFAHTGGLPTEPELVAELGISRNVLREAIKVLVSKGLIEVRPKSGTRVRAKADWNVLDPDVVAWFSIDGTDLRNAHDLVEFRRIIEPKAAYLAALRASNEDIERIRIALAHLVACVGKLSHVPAADISFHRSIYDASHNIVLRHLGSLLTSLFQNQVLLTTAEPGSFERGLPLHRKVTEAIARRAPIQAEKYSRQLVDMPYEDLSGRLRPKDRGLL
jgi:GntR family transcriptional regulator, galactonate operon transcriptional repressor